MAEIKLIRVVQEGIAAPSQWNAWDEDGLYYYLRYRHGKGTVHQEPSEDTGTWSYNNESMVRYFKYGDELDGYLTLKHFAELADIDISGVIEYRKLDAGDHG